MNTIPKTHYEKQLDDKGWLLDIIDDELKINYDDNVYRYGIAKDMVNNDNLEKAFSNLDLTLSQYRQGFNQLGNLLMVRGCGSNIFHLPKDLSMALSDTDPTSNIEMIRMPHRAFFVDVNREDLSMHNGRHLVGIFFFFDRYDDKPDVDVPTARLEFVSGINSDDSNAITAVLNQNALDQKMTDVFGVPLENQEATIDKNTMIKCVFLCFNILLYMSSEQADMKRIPAFLGDRPKKKKKARKDRICRISYVVLGQGFRYSSGGAAASSGRVMMRHSVRGHWRHQPYGPRSNPLYKTIWILPHWRGDDIAGVIEKRHYFKP